MISPVRASQSDAGAVGMRIFVPSGLNTALAELDADMVAATLIGGEITYAAR